MTISFTNEHNQQEVIAVGDVGPLIVKLREALTKLSEIALVGDQPDTIGPLYTAGIAAGFAHVRMIARQALATEDKT